MDAHILMRLGEGPRSAPRSQSPASTAVRASAVERTRARVLLSAYACDPGRGSEHGVGWNWTRELSRHVELWVATRANRRQAIESWERDHGALGVHWIYLEGPRWLLWLKKHGLGIHGYYHLWQRMLLGRARALHRTHRFDAIFHLTMNGYREPGYLWKLPCPFVWGPIGGLQDAAPAFLVDEPVRTRTVERVRGWLNRAMAQWSWRPRQARARAALLMAANRDAVAWARAGTRAVCGSEHRVIVIQLLEAGVVEQPSTSTRSDHEILWVGSDERRKNPRFALKAFALLHRQRPTARLTMVGLSMARQEELRAWADRRGCALDGVAFHARLPRAELAAFYGRAAQFWFTSYRDTSGNVLLEALSCGAPCIAFDHQGAADILAGGAGELVRPAAPSDMLASWLRTSRRLHDDANARRRLGECGRTSVLARYAWADKPAALVTLLDHLVEA